MEIQPASDNEDSIQIEDEIDDEEAESAASFEVSEDGLDFKTQHDEDQRFFPFFFSNNTLDLFFHNVSDSNIYADMAEPSSPILFAVFGTAM